MISCWRARQTSVGRGIDKARSGGILCLATLLSIAAASPWASSPAAMPQAKSDSLEVVLLRTWQPEDVTIVDGLANVPLAMLAGGTTGAYRFELLISDSIGNSLYRDSWERALSDRAVAFVEHDAASMMESFQFGVRPGSYEVEIRAYPTDAPDLGVATRRSFAAFPDRPGASDLFLAQRMDPIVGEAGGGGWSITHGGIGMGAAVHTVVRPDDPVVYYYLELYGGEDSREFLVGAEILRGNEVIFSSSATAVEVGPEGLPFSGRMPLTGLPPGTYRLSIVLRGEGSETRHAAAFLMQDRSTGRSAVVGNESEEARFFASVADKELTETFGGVAVLITDTERRVFEALPPDGQRQYLTQFFQQMDPSPGSPGNEFLDEYVERIGVIRARWGESVGTSERLPWTVDMGRIYMRYGEPEERVINSNPSDLGEPTSLIGAGSFGGEPPYEIWRYQANSFAYLFIEETRMNSWRLVFSTNPKIQSLADWPRRVGPSAIADMTNMGINLVNY